MKKSIFFSCLLITCIQCSLECTFRGHKLSLNAWNKIISPETACIYGHPIANQQTINGELILIREDSGSFRFGTVEKTFDNNQLFNVKTADGTKTVARATILKLNSLWHCLFQSTVSLKQFDAVQQQYLEHYFLTDKPYAHIITVKPQSKFILIGDLHGNFTALAAIVWRLRQLGIIDDNLRLAENYTIICTGDYINKGPDGIETLYVLMKLSLINQDRVFLLRGNHENFDMAEDDFLEEWEEKFGDNEKSQNAQAWLFTIFDSFAHVLLIGLQQPNKLFYTFILCCHGGVETTSNVIKQAIQSHLLYGINHTTYELPFYKGFIWNDFHANPPEDLEDLAQLFRQSERGPYISLSHYGMTTYLQDSSKCDDEAQNYQVIAIMRGHQHSAGLIAQLKPFAIGQDWRPLEHNQLYPITYKSAFTFISCNSLNMYESTFGHLHAGSDGIWYLKPHISHHTQTQFQT